MKEIDNYIEDLVHEALPSFSRNLVIKKFTKKIFSLTKKRDDGLFEKVYFEKELDGDDILVWIQFGINFFDEVPIPSGCFGYDTSIIELVDSDADSDMLDRLMDTSTSLYLVNQSIDINESQKILIYLLKKYLKLKYDFWANILNKDDNLKKAFQLSKDLESVSESLLSLHFIESKLSELNIDRTLLGFSKRKIAVQLLKKAQGDKHWFLY